MSQYIVSARKYRPDSFESLIGQDNIAKTLSNSIKRGKLAHAYLFCGPRGVGKTTTARIFAKMINCENPGPEMEPCGKCESCISFQEGRSYCIHELDAASNNSVDDIKALMEQVQVPPQVGRYSVYIIDEVHMLSQAAFNAFLKTLEEPPSHAIFILATTEKHKILPTILSRCQTYDFNRISVTDIVRNLRTIASKEGVSIDDESLHVIAVKADGAMRDALTIFDQTVAFCGADVKYSDVIRNLNVLDYEYSFSMVDNFLAGNYGAALTAFDDILSKGFNALHFVADLSSHLRDLVVTKTAGAQSLLEMPDSMKKRYQEQASRCPVRFLYDALGITTACEMAYKSAVNPRLHIEYALMRLSYLSAGVPDSAPAAAAKPVQADAKPAAAKPVKADAKPAAAKPDAEAKPDAIPSETPQPQPVVPRKRAARTGAALSVNAIMEEKDTTENKEETTGGAAVPDDTAIMLHWKTLADEYAAKRPRLANTLSGARVELKETDGGKNIEFFVLNDAVKTWIEEKLLRDMENRMREKTSCRKITITVSVVPDTETAEKVPYMPEEKAKDLMDKKPEVRELVAALGLDTK